jgi:membrane protein
MSNTVRGPETGETIGALVHQLTEQVPQLVRSEVKLAQAELTEKGKRAGLGVGMFSAAGLLAFFALATLIATAVLALDLVLPAWAAALIVAGVLLVAAGVAAMLGKSKVQSATPAKPERAMEGMRQDVQTIKGNGS